MTILHDRKCDQCMRRRLVESAADTGTIVYSQHVELWFCRTCMDEAREGFSVTSMIDEAHKWRKQEAEWAK